MVGDFQWGPARDGLRLGLRIPRHIAPESPMPYEVAVENLGTERALLVLFSDLEREPRSRLRIERSDNHKRTMVPAIVGARPTTSGYRIVAEIEPGGVWSRAALPVTFSTRSAGQLALQVVVGGTEACREEMISGIVEVVVGDPATTGPGGG